MGDAPAGGSQGSASREALQLVHHHPGRLRVRATVFEKDAPALAAVRARLDALPGILEVGHTATTGSLLVAYQPGMVEPDTIVAAIAEAADLDLPREEARDPRRPALIAIGVGRELNAAVEELTGRRADLGSLVPAALAGIAAYSWLKHEDSRLPRWDNLLYWSYSIFRDLNKRAIAEAAISTTSDGVITEEHDGAK
jgi:hypothetical protein